MDGLNCVMLLGYLGDDAELRSTQAGQSVLSFRVAVTESYLDKDKERRERTDWIGVVVWGRLAEALQRLLLKGTQVFVEGSLRTSSYDDRDGNKRYKTEVNARKVVITSGRGRSEEQGGRDGDDRGGGGYDNAPRGGRSSGGGGGRPAGRSGGGGREVDVCHFGKCKGTRFADCDDRDLQWYRDALESNVDDPAKERYRNETLAALAALDEVLRSRGVEPGPRPSGGYSGGRGRGRLAPAPAPPEPGHGDGGYADDGGGDGGGFDDDIPFASCDPNIEGAWMRHGMKRSPV